MNRFRRQLLWFALVASAACKKDGGRQADSVVYITPQMPLAGKPPQVSYRGIGALRVGMTVPEARNAVPRFEVSEDALKIGCGYATAPELPAGVSVMVENGIVARVEVDTTGIPTPEGALVGDTEQRVKSLYGNRISVSPHKYTDGHYLTVRPTFLADSAYRIVFETDGQRVLEYRVGKPPQVDYVEGCS